MAVLGTLPYGIPKHPTFEKVNILSIAGLYAANLVSVPLYRELEIKYSSSLASVCPSSIVNLITT